MDLVDGEVDRLGHLIRVLVVQAERAGEAEQDAAAGDVARQPHQEFAGQALVGQVLPVGQKVDLAPVDR